jgi:hypothetical protein
MPPTLSQVFYPNPVPGQLQISPLNPPLEGVDSFNNRRLLEPIGGIPPAEAEACYYAQFEDAAMAA